MRVLSLVLVLSAGCAASPSGDDGRIATNRTHHFLTTTEPITLTGELRAPLRDPLVEALSATALGAGAEALVDAALGGTTDLVVPVRFDAHYTTEDDGTVAISSPGAVPLRNVTLEGTLPSLRGTATVDMGPVSGIDPALAPYICADDLADGGALRDLRVSFNANTDYRASDRAVTITIAEPVTVPVRLSIPLPLFPACSVSMNLRVTAVLRGTLPPLEEPPPPPASDAGPGVPPAVDAGVPPARDAGAPPPPDDDCLECLETCYASPDVCERRCATPCGTPPPATDAGAPPPAPDAGTPPPPATDAGAPPPPEDPPPPVHPSECTCRPGVPDRHGESCGGTAPETWRCVCDEYWGTTVSQVCRAGIWQTFHLSPRSCGSCGPSYSTACRQSGV